MIALRDVMWQWRQVLDGLGVEYIEPPRRSIPDAGEAAPIRLPQVGQTLLVTPVVTLQVRNWCRVLDTRTDDAAGDVAPPTVIVGLPRGRFHIFVRGWTTDSALVRCICGAWYFLGRTRGWGCLRCGTDLGDRHWDRAYDSPLRLDLEQAA